MRISSKQVPIWMITTLLLLLIMIISCARVQTEEEKEVIAVVQKAFDALAAKDGNAAQNVLLAEGQYFSIREQGEEVVVDGLNHIDFIQRIASMEDDVIERMWDPKVLIHGRIAVVWTAYDFFRNQEFDHGGVEAFTLLKTNQGWKIAGTIFTYEYTDMIESPWGPIK